ncbi:glycoside hydrolase family 16 protein [Schizophyllum fasciatum]
MILTTLLLSTLPLYTLADYYALREYSGDSFFSGWEFYDNVDNTTWGNVRYVDQATAINQGLAYVTDDGNAVIKVDDQTHIPGGWDFTNRQSVRITTTDTYPLNGLIIIDLVHIPYGCSVWPSFWSFGPSAGEWPAGGEIDIIEGVNLVEHNQMALHSTDGCFQANNSGDSGQTLERNCSTPTGCAVRENKTNSYGQAFNEAGGGVFALQMAQSGFYMWFWSRNDIPHSISGANSQSTMDTTKDWGRPSASFPASGCNDSLWQFFAPQQLVLDITLCGNWAGLPAVYGATCTNQYACLTDNVVGDGSNYADAYFEIRWIRTYTGDKALVPSSTPSPTFTLPISASSSRTSTAGMSSSSNGCDRVRLGYLWLWDFHLLLAVSLTICCTL